MADVYIIGMAGSSGTSVLFFGAYLGRGDYHGKL